VRLSDLNEITSKSRETIPSHPRPSSGDAQRISKNLTTSSWSGSSEASETTHGQEKTMAIAGGSQLFSLMYFKHQ
jgi:hypothetical protein